MSTWIDPDMHDQKKRDAHMDTEKVLVKRAYMKMIVWQDVINGYKSGVRDGAPLDVEKLARYEEGLRKATENYNVTWGCCSRRAAQIDFINSVVKAGKTDEIDAMMAPADSCRTEHGLTTIFQTLAVAAGGTITDLHS